MNMIVFWNYDVFPYCLWGPLTKATKTQFWSGPNLCFSNRARIGILPEEQAQDIIKELEEIKVLKDRADREFKLKAKDILKRIK